MELDLNLVKEKIEEYRKNKDCTQLTFIGLCDVADSPSEKLVIGFGSEIGSIFDERTWVLQ